MLKVKSNYGMQFLSNLKLMKKKDDQANNNSNNAQNQNKTSTEGSKSKGILETGWIRYIKYIENHQPPSAFFKNPSFEKQNKYEEYQKNKVKIIFSKLNYYKNNFLLLK